MVCDAQRQTAYSCVWCAMCVFVCVFRDPHELSFPPLPWKFYIQPIPGNTILQLCHTRRKDNAKNYDYTYSCNSNKSL